MTSLRNQSASLFFGKTTAFFIQMLTSVIIVRLISKAEYGLYQQFLLICTSLISILGLGLNSSLYYFFPTSSISDKKALIKQTILLELIVGLTFIVIFIGFGIPRLEWLNLENLSVFRYHIGIYIFLMIGSSIIETLFTVEKNVALNRLYHPFEKFVRLGLIVSFIFFFQDNVALIYALLVLSSLKFLYLLFYAKDYLLTGSISTPLLKSQLIYSLPIAASIILRTISVKIDKFIVNEYVSLKEFAIYTVAFISIPILSILYTSINNVVMPQIAVFCKANKLQNAASLWRKTVLKNASITIPIVVFSFVMANEIIEILYTQKYLEAAKYFRVFILILLFSMFSRGFILRGLKKTTTIFFIDLISTTITIIAGLYLIEQYHLYGAAFTALIGISLPIVIKIIYEKSLLRIPWSKLMDWKKLNLIIFTSLVSLILVFMTKIFIDNIYISFFISAVLYSISIYFLQNKYNLFLFPNILDTIIQRSRNNSTK